MADDEYSYFYGIVHPPGKKDASEVVNIADDMTHEQVKDLNLLDFAITDGHPPNGESITKHANLVRGRVVQQFMDEQGNKCILGKLMHKKMNGLQTLNKIESGANTSLSLGHRPRLVVDQHGNDSIQFLGDHIAIVENPRRPGCHIHGLVKADRIDREKVTSWKAHLRNKVPIRRLDQSPQPPVHSAPVAMEQLQAVAANQAAATASAPGLGSGSGVPGATVQQQQQQQQQQVPSQQQQQQPELTRDQLMFAAFNAAEEAENYKAEMARMKAMYEEKERAMLEREEAQKRMEREKKEKILDENVKILVDFVKQKAARGDTKAKQTAERLDAIPEGIAKAVYDDNKRDEGIELLTDMVVCAGSEWQEQMEAQNLRFEELSRKRTREPEFQQYLNRRPQISEWSTASSSSSAAAVAPPSSSMMGASSSSSTSSAPTTRNIVQERQDLMQEITRHAYSAGYVQAAVKSGGGGMNRFYETAYKHAMPKPKPVFIRK